MINLVTLQAPRDRAVRRLARSLRPEIKFLECTSYERIFRDLRVPMGHIVFSDIDMLTHYEREVVVAAADALQNADPRVKILNDPRELLERYPLLRRLEREGVNSFSVTRLDGGDRPSRYPVFIRCEDNHHGVDTDLLYNDDEFDLALAQLKKAGKLLKRRIAVEYSAQPDQNGLYRKYGVFNVGGTLIPQHLLIGQNWLLKRLSRDADQDDVEERVTFLRENPHKSEIARIFKLANIDYGRVDYTLIDSKVQVYEINTNPNLPPLLPRRRNETASKSEQRRLIRDRFIDAFNKLDTSVTASRPVRFELPAPRHHIRQWRSRQALVWARILKNYPSVKALVPRRYWRTEL